MADGDFPKAEMALTQSLADFKGQPPDEVAGLFKTRADVRATLGEDLTAALRDYDEAVRLLVEDAELSDRSKADQAELPRSYLARAALEHRLARWQAEEADLTRAEAGLEKLSRLEQTNPFLYQNRAQARMRLGQWAAAATDALEAEQQFKDTGDKIRKTLAAADAALAMYGAGDVDDSVAKMKQVFREKGLPSTNNPDDLPLLQELSRADAELHLAFAASLHADGKTDKAKEQWESGCIRLQAYVTDGLERLEEQARKEEDQVRRKINQETGAGPSLDDLVIRFNAASVGLDPDSPYVTQRTGQEFYFYKIEGQKERRVPATSLSPMERSPGERLSCTKFRDSQWVEDNRPFWSPRLKADLAEYVAAVPQAPIVMPEKGGPLSKGELDFDDPARRARPSRLETLRQLQRTKATPVPPTFIDG